MTRWSEQEYQEWLKQPSEKILKEQKIIRTNKKLEFELQKQVANYLYFQYPNLLWTASAGGMRTSIGTGKKMKLMGYRRGTPDIMIFAQKGHFKALFLELKVKDGTQTPEQKEWQIKAEERGYDYRIAYSFEEAQKIIDRYLIDI